MRLYSFSLDAIFISQISVVFAESVKCIAEDMAYSDSGILLEFSGDTRQMWALKDLLHHPGLEPGPQRIPVGYDHTVLFTPVDTACRLPKFLCTHSNAALLCVVVKNQCKQILVTIRIRLYGYANYTTETSHKRTDFETHN